MLFRTETSDFRRKNSAIFTKILSKNQNILSKQEQTKIDVKNFFALIYSMLNMNRSTIEFTPIANFFRTGEFQNILLIIIDVFTFVLENTNLSLLRSQLFDIHPLTVMTLPWTFSVTRKRRFDAFELQSMDRNYFSSIPPVVSTKINVSMLTEGNFSLTTTLTSVKEIVWLDC